MSFSSAQARQAAEYAAAALGFSSLGVARADADQGTRLRDWLNSGQHADMQWMERHLPARLNPELVLPGVRSVIMLTYEYSGEDARTEPGRIARYAQGEDYHKLLARKLEDIAETLTFYGGEQRCFTDSGPISERFFAAQAGLGWIGRNGLLNRPGKGSYCFLASILTTLELPYDTPMANRCGTCHRCEDACPTGALQNGCCDARKCLSYWTIEAHAPTPQSIAETQPERIYGCDICQEVCPWNRGKRNERIDPHLLMPAELCALSPQNLASLSQEEFERLFAASPIRRIGIPHLQRNLEEILRQQEC